MIWNPNIIKEIRKIKSKSVLTLFAFSFFFFFFWMAQKNYDQDDFLISSLVIQRSCCVLVLAYNTVEVVLLLQFLEASRVNGVYMASSIYPRQKECFISLLRARRKAVCGGQRLYIWLWLPYSTRYTTSLGIFVQRKIPNKRPAASSRSI